MTDDPAAAAQLAEEAAAASGLQTPLPPWGPDDEAGNSNTQGYSTYFRAALQMLRPGERTLPLKQSASLVVAPFEGKGHSIVGEQRIDWEPFDTMAVPGGTWCEHVNGSDKDPAILFVASDEPTLKALAFYQRHGKTKSGDIVRLP